MCLEKNPGAWKTTVSPWERLLRKIASECGRFQPVRNFWDVHDDEKYSGQVGKTSTRRERGQRATAFYEQRSLFVQRDDTTHTHANRNLRYSTPGVCVTYAFEVDESGKNLNRQPFFSTPRWPRRGKNGRKWLMSWARRKVMHNVGLLKVNPIVCIG